MQWHNTKQNKAKGTAGKEIKPDQAQISYVGLG